jgi:hypothetical protein
MSIIAKRRHGDASGRHGANGRFTTALTPEKRDQILSSWATRKEQGLNRELLALAMGVSQRTIQRVIAQDRKEKALLAAAETKRLAEEKAAKEAITRDVELEEKIVKRAKGLHKMTDLTMEQALAQARREIKGQQ